jgi:predicted RND superfamily exporter protein
MRNFFKHPALVVAGVAVITVFFALQIPRAELDNNNYRFVPESNPDRRISTRIDDTFGSSLFILVGLEREYGTVFESAFLARIREYGEWLETIEITGKISSIMNTDYITAEGDTITVESLVPDDFAGTLEEIAELRRRIHSWNIYDHALTSDDFTATQIRVPLDIASENAGNPEVMAAFLTIRDTALEMFDGMANVYVAGLPVISATINESMKADLVYLIPLVLIVVLAVLFFSFHALTPVVLPLLSAMVAVIWSIGVMPLFDIKLSVLTTVLPIILIAVGSAYGIHVVTHYMADLSGKTLNDTEHRELVFTLLRKIGKPVLLTALTTFAGFISFCFTTVPPIREFGYFASFGVVASFVVAVTLIPALLILRGPKPFSVRRLMDKNPDKSLHDTDPLQEAIADGFIGVSRKKRFVLIAACIVLAVSVYGVSRVVIDNVFIEYFKPDTDVRKSDVFVREKFGGSKVVNIVVEADDSAALLSPDVLCAIDGLHNYLEGRVPNVGKVMGFTDMVKRTNQVFNADESPDGLQSAPLNDTGATAVFGFGEPGDNDFGFGNFSGSDDEELSDIASPAEVRESSSHNSTIDIALLDRAAFAPDMSAADLVWETKKLLNYEGASYYEIPADPSRYGKTDDTELSMLVSNYLVLLSGSIDDYANDPLEPTAIRTVVQLRTTGDEDTKTAVAHLRAYIDANFPKNVTVSVGGPALVESALSFLVVQSQIVSVVISILIVFIIVAVSHKSLIAGLVGSLPLIISILIDFAVMGFMGIKLNLGTSLVASISVGIGVDYAIHFIDAYKREYRNGGYFLRRAFTSSGKAIIINAVSVGAGFAVLCFSRFNILADLGLLIALTMFTSAIASLTVIPALLAIVKPKFIYGKPARCAEDIYRRSH